MEEEHNEGLISKTRSYGDYDANISTNGPYSRMNVSIEKRDRSILEKFWDRLNMSVSTPKDGYYRSVA